MPAGPGRRRAMPDVGPIEPASKKKSTSPSSQPSISYAGTPHLTQWGVRPDVFVYRPVPAKSKSTPVNTLVEAPSQPSGGSSVPVIRAYNPTLGDKVRWWWEDNKGKIPFVNFMDMLNTEVKRAEKEILIESAYKDDPIRAALLGFEAGILKGSVLLPVTLAEAGASVVKGVKEGAEKQDTISGWLGLQHGNPLKDKPEVIRGKTYEEQMFEKMALAEYAPGVVKAEKRLEQAKGLEVEAQELAKEREELLKQYEWFEQARGEAEKDPTLARLYNAEARTFNQRVMEFNRRVDALQRKLDILDVEGSVRAIDEFNKNLEKSSKFMLAGELVGSAVGTSAVMNTLSTVDYYFGPERTVSREFVIKEARGPRVVRKETTYKGVINKRPVRTTQISVVAEGNADDVMGSAVISFNDDVANAVEFKAKFGKPAYERSIKVTEEDAFLHIGLNDAREFQLNKWLRKPGFVLRERPVSEPVMWGERVFSPEEWNALQRIARKAVVSSGEKWSKVSVSGNVAQGVYDPPTARLLGKMDEGVSSMETVKVDLGNFNFNLIEGKGPKTVVAPPVVAKLEGAKTVLDVDVERVTAPVKSMDKSIRVIQSSSEAERAARPMGIDYRSFLHEQQLKQQKKIVPTTSKEINETPRPINTQVPDTITGPLPVEVGSTRVHINVGKVQTQKLRPVTLVSTLTVGATGVPPKPPSIKVPVVPPFKKKWGSWASFGLNWDAYTYQGWLKRYDNKVFAGDASIERGLNAIERSLERLNSKLGGGKRRRKR